jgi:hypothetical protein
VCGRGLGRQKTTGYKLDVVTVRKLVFEPDVFAFADQVIENWFPTAELGDKMGVLLVNTSGKVSASITKLVKRAPPNNNNFIIERSRSHLY